MKLQRPAENTGHGPNVPNCNVVFIAEVIGKGIHRPKLPYISGQPKVYV